MPKLVKSELCCGCSACANKCAKGAIKMQPNEEGFMHPIVDYGLCVDCGACENVCPGLIVQSNKNIPPPIKILYFTLEHSSYNIKMTLFVTNRLQEAHLQL